MFPILILKNHPAVEELQVSSATGKEIYLLVIQPIIASGRRCRKSTSSCWSSSLFPRLLNESADSGPKYNEHGTREHKRRWPSCEKETNTETIPSGRLGIEVNRFVEGARVRRDTPDNPSAAGTGSAGGFACHGESVGKRSGQAAAVR